MKPAPASGIVVSGRFRLRSGLGSRERSRALAITPTRVTEGGLWCRRAVFRPSTAKRSAHCEEHAERHDQEGEAEWFAPPTLPEAGADASEGGEGTRAVDGAMGTGHIG